MTNPAQLLAAATRVIADHEHCTGDRSSGRRCDDARLLAEAWKELLGQEPTDAVERVGPYYSIDGATVPGPVDARAAVRAEGEG